MNLIKNKKKKVLIFKWLKKKIPRSLQNSLTDLPISKKACCFPFTKFGSLQRMTSSLPIVQGEEGKEEIQREKVKKKEKKRGHSIPRLTLQESKRWRIGVDGSI